MKATEKLNEVQMRRHTGGKTEGEMESERATGSFSASKPMASSQNVQTLKNSRQRAGREGRCQEWEEGGGGGSGGRGTLEVCGRGKSAQLAAASPRFTLTSRLW